MPVPNVFTADAFRLDTMTAAINKVPYQPRRLGALGLFEERGISTLTASIEERDGVLSLLSVRPRGAPGKPISDGDRRAIPFIVPHIPATAQVLADEVMGVRQFGTENTAETVQNRVNERLADMQADIEYTNECHRVKAVKGVYVDSNGDDVSLFTTFGVSQQDQAIGLHATNSSKIREKALLVRKKVREGLGGLPWRGVRVLCSDDFWVALLEDKDTKSTYLNQVQASELRGDPTQSFTAFGMVWEWYEGTSDATLGSDAYAVPEGVPGLFVTRYAPANYEETVNTVGAPYYAKGEPMRFGKGVDLEAQSNPLNLCTRPRAVIKLTI